MSGGRVLWYIFFIVVSSSDAKFLTFFFRRVRANQTGRYEGDFPYVSPCGPEMNYIRCDDLPVVFTHLLDKDGNVIDNISNYGRENISPSDTTMELPKECDSVSSEMLSYGGTGGKLTVPFQPSKLCMLPATGRVYHTGLERLGGVGLVKSSLALELSRFFVYNSRADENSAPIGFTWRGRTWDLDPMIVTGPPPAQHSGVHCTVS